MNIFALSLVLVAVLAEEDFGTRGKAASRGCVFPNVPQNLNARTQSRGRIMRFMCEPGFVLIGRRFSTCLRGRWSSPPPICISKGCPVQTPPENGRMTESYDGAMVTFGCNPGYVQNGSSIIYCALPQWNGTAPTCTVPTISPNVSCDFEGPDLCGWSHDVSHDFEWKRNKFSTPSGHVNTGPSFDHTLGKGMSGNYMYLEASAPQKQGDITRLFSPVYPAVLGGSCFTFWYHMYGSSIGSLGVYLKEENQVLAELTPAWSKDHQTGDVWYQGQIDVPQLSTNFQLVIEGVRGADYMGDIAVDDVSLNPGPCSVLSNQSQPVQVNGTSGTTTDEGGGAEEADSTRPTTTASTREVTTTTLAPTTATMEPRTEGTTPRVIPSIPSAMSSTTPSVTNIIVTSTSSTSKIAEPTSAKTETTTAPTQPQQTDYPSTQVTRQIYSTSPRINASKTTTVLISTESTTVNYRYSTKPSLSDTTTTPSTTRKITSSNPTTSSVDFSSTPIQSTTTVLPTTKKAFVFPKSTQQTQMTTTSLPIVSTTTRSTTYPESTLSIATKRLPFIIKTPNTTTTTPTTTTTTSTATNKVVYTPALSQSTVSTTDTATTPIRVPDSSNLTATTAAPVTTTKTTTIPRARTTSTRKPFIYIVPKSTRPVTDKPFSSTTQNRQAKSTYPLTAKTTEVTTQYSTSTEQGTTKRKLPIFPPKQVTTPSSTTDIRNLFPKSPDGFSFVDNEDNSKQSDDSPVQTVSEPVSEAKAEASARWIEFPRRPHPHEKQTTGAGVSALATACSLGAVFLVVSVFTVVYLVRRRKLKQQHFGSNSEMRYITQSEELEFGSADNSDMIKLL